MAAIFNKNIFLVSKTFGTKNLSNFLRRASNACVCAINVFGSHRHSAACSVIFHRARFALRQVPLCSRAMLCRVGKYRIPSVNFHCIVRVYLCSVKLYCVLRSDASFCEYRIPQLRDEKSDVFFRSRKLPKKHAKLINSNTKT